MSNDHGGSALNHIELQTPQQALQWKKQQFHNPGSVLKSAVASLWSMTMEILLKHLLRLPRSTHCQGFFILQFQRDM